MSDFFASHYGASSNMHSARRRRIGAMLDPIFDASLLVEGIKAIDEAITPRSILAVGIQVPGREDDIHMVLNRLKRTSRHWVQRAFTTMADGLGKFANVERALAGVDLEKFDWLVVADDDIDFDRHMLNRLISLSEKAGFSISQPAHRLSSYASYEITLRKPFSLVRETHFVEIGPVTAFRKSVFADLIPFPQSRWCYGIDIVWSELVKRKGLKMGIVDAATIRHLRPIAGGYDMDAARAEGEALVKSLGHIPSRADILGFERPVPISYGRRDSLPVQAWDR